MRVSQERHYYYELHTDLEGLGRWLTVKTFWKAMLFCLVLNWAALNDGVSIVDKRDTKLRLIGSTVPTTSPRQCHPHASFHQPNV